MLQHNRELKQLIQILSTSQRRNYKKSLKPFFVVFHVEDLVAQKLLTILLDGDFKRVTTLFLVGKTDVETFLMFISNTLQTKLTKT